MGLLVGCGPQDAMPVLRAQEIESPAAEGSGEPFLSSTGDAVLLSWLEARPGGVHELRFARYDTGRWSDPSIIASGTRFFVNWADFPSVSEGPDGVLWAHWLERGSGGGYDERSADFDQCANFTSESPQNNRHFNAFCPQTV
jgi:hypothetical protein